MKDLTTWHVHAMGVGAAAVLTAAFWIAAVSPYLQQRAASGSESDELLAAQDEAVRLTRSAAANETALRDAEAAVENDAVELRPATRINRVLRDLIALADRFDVRFDAVEPGDATPGEMFEYVGLQLRGRGAFGDCLAMLEALHETHPDIKVVGTRLDAGTQPGRAGFSLDLVWFAAPAGG